MFDEMALSVTVKEIEAILGFGTFGKIEKLCFATIGKNSEIHNGRHF